MKITFEISEHDARYFRSYASLGRFCDQILRLTGQLYEGKVIDKDLSQLVGYVEEDVQGMKPVISNIHSSLRPILIQAGVKPLWDQNQGCGLPTRMEGETK